MAGFDDWLAGATGSYLLPCEPLDDLVTFFGGVAERRVGDTLFVTTTRSAERLDASARSTADEIVDATPRTGEHATNVGSPADLTGISMPISTFLQDAEDPAVAVDSVSPLLYHAEEAAVFRFLSVLTTHITRSDGLGIFAIVPAAHRVETFATFQQVFDGHLELDGPDDRVRLHPRADPTEGSSDEARDVPDGWHSL